MTRLLLKYLGLALVGAALIFAAVAAVQFWFLNRMVTDVAGAVQKGIDGGMVTERVSILESVSPGAAGYALVLEDLVTGKGPRLIEGSELEILAPQLWYQESRIEGGLFPAARDSARARLPVATLLKDGAAIRLFTCPTDDCGAWFGPGDQKGASQSGFAPLREASTPPGVAVEHVTGIYDSYQAYQSAHAAIVSDEKRWFAVPGAEALLAPGDGMGEIRVSLPVTLLPYAANAASPEVEAEAEAALAELAKTWLGDVGGRADVQSSWPMDLYIDWEQGLGGDTRPLTLPGISYRQSEIVLQVPLNSEGSVAARIDLSRFPAPDLLVLEDALLRAVELAGEDTSCLPGCARVQSQRIKHAGDIYIRPAPSWQIESWRVFEVQP